MKIFINYATILLLVVFNVFAQNSAGAPITNNKNDSIQNDSTSITPKSTSSKSVSLAEKTKKTAVNVLITRAVEGVSQNKSKYSWFSAVLEEYYYLRFQAYHKDIAVSREEYLKSLPISDDYGVTIPENVIFKIANEKKATHVILHNYDINKSMVNYYLEVTRVDNKKVVANFEKTFPLNSLDKNLSECTKLVFEKLQLNLTSNLTKTIEHPILGINSKNIKLLGIAIQETGKKMTLKNAQKFLKITKKDPSFDLAVFIAALAYEELNNCNLTSQLLNQLIIRNGLQFPELYIRTSKFLRLCQSLENAKRILLHAQKYGWETPGLYLENAFINQAYNKPKEAHKMYEKIIQINPNQPDALLYFASQKRKKGLYQKSLDILNPLISSKVNIAEVYIEKAKNLIALDKNESAITTLLSAKKIWPDNFEVDQLLGDINFKLKKYEAASVLFQKTFEKKPDNLKLLLKTSKAFVKSKNPKKALDILNKYKAKFYNTKQVLKEIGLVKLHMKDTADALLILEKCKGINPPDTNVFIALGNIYASNGKYGSAISMYEKAEQYVKDTFSIKLNLSNLYFIQNDYNNAEKGFKSIISLNPKYPKANQLLADILFIKGKKKEALKYYLNEKSHHGPNGHIQKRITQIYFDQKDFENAKKECEVLIKLEPSKAFGYYHLARIAVKQKKVNQANEYFLKGKSKGKSKKDIYFELGKGFTLIGSIKNAIISYNSGLEFDPRNEAALIALGKLYEKEKKGIPAAQTYLKVYDINQTKNVKYLEDAGHLFYKNGAKDDAYKAYNKLLQKGNKKSIVAINVASIEFESKQYEKVISLLANLDNKVIIENNMARILAFSNYYTSKYKKVEPFLKTLLKKNPRSIDIVEMAAITYEKINQIPLAISMYKKFLTFKKTDKHKEYAFHIATLYEKQKNVASAKAQYQKNLMSYPNDFRNYENLSNILIDTQLYGQAILYLKKAIEIPSCPEELYKKLAELYTRQKNKKDASLVYQKYLKLNPTDSKVWLTLGTILYSQKAFSKAIEPLEMAASLLADDTTCLNMLANSYVKTGNIPKAIYVFTKRLIKDPNNKKVLIELSNLYLHSKQSEKAAEIYLRIYDINNSKNNSYLAKAGHLYFKIKMFTKASTHYNTFLSNKYKDSQVNINLAEMEYKNKNYPKVISLLSNLPDKDIDKIIVIKQLVLSYKATGNESKGLPFIKKLLAKNPRDMKVVEIAAIAYEKSGDLASAASMYSKFLTSPTTDSHQNYSYHLATLYEKINKWSLAIAQFKKNLKDYPNDLRNYKKLTRYYIKKKNYEQTIKILSKASVVPKAPPSVDKKLAEVYLLLNRIPQAITIYERYLSKAPNDSKSWYKLGALYLSQKNYKKAIVPLEKASSLDPNNAKCYYDLGYSYVKINQTGKAIQPLKNALNLSNNDNKILLLLTKCYTDTKDTTALISVMQRRAQNDKKDFDLHYDLGELLVSTNQNEQAILSYENASKIDSNNIKTHINLVNLYEKANNKKKWLAHIGELLRISPKNPEFHYKRAYFYIKNRQKEKAKISLKKTIALKPKHHKAHFKFGEILKEEKKFKTAYHHFYEASKYNPANIEYLLSLALTSEVIGKKSFAITIINKALKLDPSNARVVQFAGYIYYKAGERKKARDLLVQGIELNDSCSFCYDILGKLYYNNKNYVKASSYLKMAIKQNDKDDKIMLLYANSLYFQYKIKQSLTFYNNAFNLNPKNDEALYRLVAIYISEGNINKAKKLMNNLNRTKMSGWVYLAAASLYTETKKIDKAHQSYKLALKKMPKNFEALLGMGNISISKKRYDYAIECFSRAMVRRPESLETYIGMGKAYYHLKNYNAALELFKDIAKKESYNVDVHLMMGQIYSKLKKHEAAVNILEKGLKIKGKNAELQFVLGRELKNTFQFEKSIDSFLKAVKYDKSKAVDAYLAIGNIYYHKLKSNKNAKRYYTKYVKAGGKDSKIKSLINNL